ncbi:hypothetical protein GCM10022224_080260 [Nonomuraea antimicrobica]|uniref:Uncharacterized protein n=1 Tax=Nonomuraea antimicrobica TaxID=561173 RepID=A0ABP7DCF6_9ACTN
MLRTLLTVMVTAAACAAAPATPPPPPASTKDPAGIVMGVKTTTTGNVLMIGVLNRSAYERSATPAQIRACTKRPDQRYPGCLPADRRGPERLGEASSREAVIVHTGLASGALQATRDSR